MLLISVTLAKPIKVEVVEKKTKEKKEQLSKKQKARLQDKLVDGKLLFYRIQQLWLQSVNQFEGELPRGHDWVCLIRHLSQLGTVDQQSAPISWYFSQKFKCCYVIR